jgi:chorismate dehydratase
MRLALIPFANTAPYFHFLAPAWLKGQTLVSDAPKDLGNLARENAVDAGVLSLVDVWDLEKRGLFEPLGDLGIAGHGPIGSILLFGVRDPRELEGASIGVTGQTATTVRLLEVWLKGRVGLKSWNLVELDQPSQAVLLIGDQAMARSLSLSTGEPRPIDLSAEWTEWTGLSFVFARWAVRKNLPAEEKAGLSKAVTASLEKSLSPGGLVELSRHLSSQTGFPTAFLADYLRQIRYFLGNDERKGLALFREKLEEL